MAYLFPDLRLSSIIAIELGYIPKLSPLGMYQKTKLSNEAVNNDTSIFF
jgi:hypothetical protein